MNLACCSSGVRAGTFDEPSIFSRDVWRETATLLRRVRTSSATEGWMVCSKEVEVEATGSSEGPYASSTKVQRTFEGAYIRTSLGQFSFALVVLKIFTSEFYSIGMMGENITIVDPVLTLYHRSTVCCLWRRHTGRECLQTYARQPTILQRGWR